MMKKRWLDRLFGGVVLIGIGVIFLLNQLGVIDVSLGYIIGHYWPVILIILGAKELLKGRKSFVGAAFLLLIGTYFLGRNEGWDWISPGSFFKIIIPALLIIAGLYVIFKPHDRTPPPRPHGGDDQPAFTPEPPEPEDLTANSTLDQQFEEKFGIPYTERNQSEHKGPHVEIDDDDDDDFDMDDTDDDDIKDRYKHYKKRYKQQKKYHQQMRHQMRHQMRQERRHGHSEWDGGHHEFHGGHPDGGKINRSAFIGDIHLGRDYFELKPTNLSQFIGDTVLDLTNAHIPYGETKINISAFIGDIKVYVPDDTDLGISVNSSSFIGDMSVLNESRSGFMSSFQTKTPFYKEARKKIRINISAFIGDIKVNKVG
ncbi:cell wall-active antibiotics response protein LiaF [Paenibacillus sp. KQZ6P-2]|uniref:Cell wall-active antibiotics response protein LiaF n=1 Tax=Paenibacillus mangrovi TaxID=2931978 RepID=A0A9X1WSZ3_9BACL|nr:cell wall-active antibiotics response protein LiaF [Paenibacillus mangrovi]MCJ8013360.1 cell wall-active antibiotics response protein LiaF [Paenibacillus mangrovi]